MIQRLLNFVELSKVILKNQLSIKDGSEIIKEFENNFKKYIGTDFALATNNGTSALHSAYFALGLKRGDEVILPSYTWHATAMPLVALGIKPVFAEINPKTLTIDLNDVNKKINKKTKAIVAVHLFGNVCDMDGLLKLKKKYGVYIVEDASHSFGATYNGKKIGSIGDIGCFSLHQSKAVSGGEAGIFVTNNMYFYERALVFGHHGRLEEEITNSVLKKYSYTGLGFKYRPNPFSIALANRSLRSLDKRNDKNNLMINKINKLLEKIDDISIPLSNKCSKFGSFYGYRIIYNGDLPKKIEIIKFLNDRGINAREENYLLLHTQPIFKSKLKLPITEEIYKKIIRIEL